MKEIEIKAKLRDKKSVMKKLESLGCKFESAITQEDRVYLEGNVSTENLLGNMDGKIVLRLRVKNGSKVLFTLKKRTKIHLEAIEHELEVSSLDEMEKIILLMGYKESVRVNKTRIITHYKGDEICIDDVEGLGTFIEMERLVSDGDAKEIQEELFKFFEKIGISRKDRVLFGYDILMLKKLK